MTVGCKDKKPEPQPQDYLRPASVDFSKGDTSSINKLVDDFIANVNKRNISDASAALYLLKDGQAVELPLDKRQQFESIISRIPLNGCELSSFELQGEKDNKVAVAIKITPDANVETGKGTIKLVLNPVRVNGKWYLTLRDNYAEGIQQPVDQ